MFFNIVLKMFLKRERKKEKEIEDTYQKHECINLDI